MSGDGGSGHAEPRDLGMATAEMAAVLPVLGLLLCFGLWAVAAVSADVRCADAAREAARSAARGDSPADVRAVAMAAAPPGSVVTVDQLATSVRVTVVARIGPLDRRFGSISVAGAATAEREPGDVP